MKKIAFVLSLVALLAASSSTGWAQTIPADVANPRLDVGDPGGLADIPALNPDVVLPNVQFIFDSLLDPQQISALQVLGPTSIDDPRLSAAARSLIRNHLVAMQQVELAIRFLQTSRDDILAGKSQPFNSVYGNISIERDVAILAPTPVTSNATLVLGTTNAQGGVSPPQLTFAATGNNNANTAYVFGDYLANRSIGRQGGTGVGNKLGSGDFVYLTSANSSVTSTATTGVVQRVFAYIPPPVQQGGGGGGGGGGAAGQERIILDPNQGPISRTLFTGGNNNRLAVYRILRFERQTDSTRYEQVLATFQSIRNSLQGVVPGLATNITPLAPSAIRYNRAYADINRIWAPGVAQFTQLNGTVSLFMSDNSPGLISTRGADRLVRQDGFSTSDSFAHLDRLEDQAGLRLTDVRARPTLPLLWSEDNDLPVTFGGRGRIAAATDFDRAYFRDRQTIFSAPDNVFTQYLGRAFFEETLLHASSFYDTGVASETALAQAIRQARFPAGGALQNNVSQNNGTQPILELGEIPESGTPRKSNTELRKWQMIIESFAEYTTDLTQFDVAAVGLSRTFGGTLPGNLTPKDAGNYARFANLLGGSNLDSIDLSRVEPFGKRAAAGFNPVVPVN